MSKSPVASFRIRCMATRSGVRGFAVPDNGHAVMSSVATSYSLHAAWQQHPRGSMVAAKAAKGTWGHCLRHTRNELCGPIQTLWHCVVAYSSFAREAASALSRHTHMISRVPKADAPA